MNNEQNPQDHNTPTKQHTKKQNKQMNTKIVLFFFTATGVRICSHHFRFTRRRVRTSRSISRKRREEHPVLYFLLAAGYFPRAPSPAPAASTSL